MVVFGSKIWNAKRSTPKHFRYSLHNALRCEAAVLCTHFAACEELEENKCEKLSNDAKTTIELVKKLSDNDKVRPFHSDETFGSDGTSLLMHSKNFNANKRQWKIIDKDTFKK